MLKIAVFVSGGGTDLQSVIDAAERKEFPAVVDFVVAGKKDIYAIERAKRHGIAYGVFAKFDYPSAEALCLAQTERLKERGIDLIVLAGYLNILTKELIEPFRGRIINIHPSLIPKHCGMGYYGMKVHNSVIASGDTESGATVHFVNEIADGGEIIMQGRVPVLPEDTAETLATRVLEEEHRLLPLAIKKVISEKFNRA